MAAKRTRMLRQALSIDPGWWTAVAEWQGTMMPIMHAIKLPKAMHGSGASWGAQVRYMATEFHTLLQRIQASGNVVDWVYIEGVELWEGSLTSMTAARRGDTFRLASVAGAYAGVASAAGVGVTVYRPQEWKGQLTKEAVQLRVQRVWSRYLLTHGAYNNHEYDAIGIGMAAMGEL